MYDVVPSALACLAISTLFYVWRDRIRPKPVPVQLLRQRVAFMMWVAAKR